MIAALLVVQCWGDAADRYVLLPLLPASACEWDVSRPWRPSPITPNSRLNLWEGSGCPPHLCQEGSPGGDELKTGTCWQLSAELRCLSHLTGTFTSHWHFLSDGGSSEELSIKWTFPGQQQSSYWDKHLLSEGRKCSRVMGTLSEEGGRRVVLLQG